MNAFLSGAKINQPSLFVAGEHDTVVRDMYTGAFNALEETMPGLMLDFLRQTSS